MLTIAYIRVSTEDQIWRLDRLTRDTGDQSRLVKLFEQHCVTLHSVNEGRVEVGTAAGRMQAGMHGVFNQYYREHIVENVRMGMQQAAENGRWLPCSVWLRHGQRIPDPQRASSAHPPHLRATGTRAVIQRDRGSDRDEVLDGSPGLLQPCLPRAQPHPRPLVPGHPRSPHHRGHVCSGTAWQRDGPAHRS